MKSTLLWSTCLKKIKFTTGNFSDESFCLKRLPKDAGIKMKVAFEKSYRYHIWQMSKWDGDIEKRYSLIIIICLACVYIYIVILIFWLFSNFKNFIPCASGNILCERSSTTFSVLKLKMILIKGTL